MPLLQDFLSTVTELRASFWSALSSPKTNFDVHPSKLSHPPENLTRIAKYKTILPFPSLKLQSVQFITSLGMYTTFRSQQDLNDPVGHIVIQQQQHLNPPKTGPN